MELDWRFYKDRFYQELKDKTFDELVQIDKRNDLNTNGRGQLCTMAIIKSEVLRDLMNQKRPPREERKTPICDMPLETVTAALKHSKQFSTE